MRIDVVLPGFAADCLETLEEVQDEAAKHFKTVTVRSLAVACKHRHHVDDTLLILNRR